MQRIAVTWLFFALGWGGGNWLVRIVSVRERLSLADDTLGTVLFACAAGAMTAFLGSERLLKRMSMTRLTQVAGYAYFVTLVLAGLADTTVRLACVLYLMGASSGLLNVLMNSLAVALEGRMNRSILGQLHGACSLGGLLGATCGSAVIALDVSTFVHLLGVGIVLSAVTFGLSKPIEALAPMQAGEAPGVEVTSRSGKKRTKRAPLGEVRMLGAMVLCAAICEGAMADWTGVYLREELHVSLGAAARGYMVFALTMVLSRLLADRFTAHFGPRRLMTYSGFLAAGCVALELATQNIWVTQIGIAGVGVGLACTVPMIFREATRRNPRQPDRALARMANYSYSGFLIGPPLIGHLAHAISLRLALVLLAMLACFIGYGGTRLASQPKGAAPGTNGEPVPSASL
jgi:fucose permease